MSEYRIIPLPGVKLHIGGHAVGVFAPEAPEWGDVRCVMAAACLPPTATPEEVRELALVWGTVLTHVEELGERNGSVGFAMQYGERGEVLADTYLVDSLDGMGANVC